MNEFNIFIYILYKQIAIYCQGRALYDFKNQAMAETMKDDDNEKKSSLI